VATTTTTPKRSAFERWRTAARKAIGRRGLTQEAAAELLGVDVQLLRRWRYNSRPSPSVQALLSLELGVAVVEPLDEESHATVRAALQVHVHLERVQRLRTTRPDRIRVKRWNDLGFTFWARRVDLEVR